MKNVARIIIAILVVSAMTVTAFAAAFTPSVEQKEAPAVVESVIVDAEGNVVGNVAADAIVVSAIAEAAEASEEVAAAVESIKAAASVAEAAPAVVEIAAAANVDVANLVVRDMVNVEASAEVVELLKDGTGVAVTFDMDMDADAFLIVLVFVDGEWNAVAEENVEILENGNVKVVLEQVGVLAFVTEAE